jgi:FPC/CPF motif-containing protein YcgG
MMSRLGPEAVQQAENQQQYISRQDDHQASAWAPAVMTSRPGPGAAVQQAEDVAPCLL